MKAGRLLTWRESRRRPWLRRREVLGQVAFLLSLGLLGLAVFVLGNPL